MSKWITGFPPKRAGNYLTCRILSGFDPTTTVCRRERLDYDIRGLWINRDGNTQFLDSHVFVNLLELKIIFWWWDEYGITNKIVRKLSFTKPKNREI